MFIAVSLFSTFVIVVIIGLLLLSVMFLNHNHMSKKLFAGVRRYQGIASVTSRVMCDGQGRLGALLPSAAAKQLPGCFPARDFAGA